MTQHPEPLYYPLQAILLLVWPSIAIRYCKTQTGELHAHAELARGPRYLTKYGKENDAIEGSHTGIAQKMTF